VPCPSYDSVLLKLYIALCCPICYCPLEAVVLSCSSCTKFCSVRSVIVLSELRLSPAQAVHSSVLSDLLLPCPSYCSVLLKLYIVLFCRICYCPVRATVCPAQAVHRSVLSDLLLTCPSCGSVLLKLYIALFCPICYCFVQAVVLYCSSYNSVLFDLLLSCTSYALYCSSCT
jgi:hypothetical protein